MPKTYLWMNGKFTILAFLVKRREDVLNVPEWLGLKLCWVVVMGGGDDLCWVVEPGRGDSHD